jgi:hypothetical protein
MIILVIQTGKWRQEVREFKFSETGTYIKNLSQLRRMMEGVNSSMIYLLHCKKFCEIHNILPTQHNNKRESVSEVQNINNKIKEHHAKFSKFICNL